MARFHLIILYLFALAALILAALAFWSKIPEASLEEIQEQEQSMVQFPSLTRDSIRLFELPDSLDFAGEKVPLENEDILERLEREIYVNAYWESNMILLLKRSSKYLPDIERILKEQGIPEDFKYLAIAESGLMNVGSPAGARGYWQILEDTGKEYGLEISTTVKKAHSKFGDWTAVAASYNMGQSGFSKRQEEQFHRNYYDLYLNEETSRYLFRILAFKVIFENPGKFGYHLQEKDFYDNPEFKTFKVQGDIKDLPQWAKTQGSNFKYLKLYNPWLRERNLKARKGKVYEIRLPK
jgi:hypothetical protein